MLSHELTRYADFSISMLRLKAPAGSELWWQKGVEIAMSLNAGIRHMVGDWVWILGDDHTFHSDVLVNLLALDVDIVAPACSSRQYPFWPVIYPFEQDGKLMQGPWELIPPSQLTEVAAVGSAGMLIRKRVLDAIGEPWFEAGKHQRDAIGEDLWFCRRARELGFKVHVDTREMIGHITPATIWPAAHGGKMLPLVNLNGDEKRWLRLDKMITFEKQEPLVPTPKLTE